MSKKFVSKHSKYWRLFCINSLLISGVSFSLIAKAEFQPIPEESLRTTKEMQSDLHRSIIYLNRHHYNKIELDDALSSQILTRYLKSIDPNRHYFYSSDIELFKKFEYQIDDQFKAGQLQLGFEIYKILRTRVKEREEYASQLLSKGFNFDIEEEYILDRAESTWIKTPEEMNDVWRKSIKNSVITQMLEGTSEEKIRETLEKRYARNTHIIWQTKPEEIFEIFFNAYMKEIGPHTQYMSRVTAENFNIHMSLSLEGIGASLQSENDYTIVRKIIVGGPANKDGQLKVDDKIVGVGQSQENIEDVTGWRLMDVVKQIRGKKGTTVFLKTISSGSAGSPPKVISIVRDVINLEDNAAKLEYQIIDDKNFAVIEVPSFYAKRNREKSGKMNIVSTSKDVQKLIIKAQESGKVDGLILDLRGNGGGYLTEAINLTGLFIDEGPVVQVQDPKQKPEQLNDDDSGTAYDGPLAVLVDKSSASASEIFAGAIKDYGRGIIIGERTFGKGTVQTTQPLESKRSNNSASSTIKFTIQQFFRVNGESTQVKGVEPDITFNLGVIDDDFGEGSLDNALPWAQISPAIYSTQKVNKISALTQRHLSRTKTNPAFAFLQNTNNIRDKNKEVKSVPLARESRKAWFNERESERVTMLNKYRQSLKLEPITSETLQDSDKDLPNGDKHWDRVLQKEAAYILSDFISETVLEDNKPTVKLTKK
jgi:carboxyl-terminal processing protease